MPPPTQLIIYPHLNSSAPTKLAHLTITNIHFTSFSFAKERKHVGSRADVDVSESGSRVLALKKKQWSLPQVLVHRFVLLKVELHLHRSGFATVSIR
jgi:hypothetical protein